MVIASTKAKRFMNDEPHFVGDVAFPSNGFTKHLLRSGWLSISRKLGMRPLMERVLSRRDILKA